MIKKLLIAALLVFIAFLLVQFFYPGSAASLPQRESIDVIAHRGLHTNWEKGTYDLATGCEATHIYTPTHGYIENTLESIGAAFDLGATIVEIDIRRTSDDHLVIFHDFLLECRTDGQGNLSDHPLEALQSLDIGYGYTHDGGKTYPFRGKGIGKMPTLAQVLQTYPDGEFLIDHKDGSIDTARLLVQILGTLPPEQQALIHYWGPPEIWDYVHEEIPSVTRLLGNRPEQKECLLPYILTLGLGGFPQECTDRGLGLTPEYSKLVAGWPYRFLDAVSHAGARFYLLIDTEKDAQAYRDLPAHGIVTDYIETVGPIFTQARSLP